MGSKQSGMELHDSIHYNIQKSRLYYSQQKVNLSTKFRVIGFSAKFVDCVANGGNHECGLIFNQFMNVFDKIDIGKHLNKVKVFTCY